MNYEMARLLLGGRPRELLAALAELLAKAETENDLDTVRELLFSAKRIVAVLVAEEMR